jgi:hypothetical protein
MDKLIKQKSILDDSIIFKKNKKLLEKKVNYLISKSDNFDVKYN